MRKMLTSAMAALALSTALLAGSPAIASAAPRETVATHTAQQSAPQDVQAAPQSAVEARSAYEYYTWYWTEENCENNGARLQVRGVISNYICQQSIYLTWYLYVLYR